MNLLCERDDFPDLVVEAGRQLGINPATVEKDYFVTEALGIIAARFGNVVLFKGGTSLSKGWKLLDRFSEDIDLYVEEDRSSSRAAKRRLKNSLWPLMSILTSFETPAGKFRSRLVAQTISITSPA